jgi:hypothetical protein
VQFFWKQRQNDLFGHPQNVGRKIVPPISTACRKVRYVKWRANTQVRPYDTKKNVIYLYSTNILCPWHKNNTRSYNF